jgi:head-tail adaptor
MTLIHPAMLTELARNFYPESITIQSATITQDNAGQEVKAWANVAGIIAVAGIVAAITLGSPKSQTILQDDKTLIQATHQIDFPAYYPAITTNMRATEGAGYYRILAVEHDSQHMSTRLLCVAMSPLPGELT